MAAKVLFVDDEPNVTQACKHVLRKEAYEILTAHCADEALRLLRDQSVDVVVSDELMPHLSGTEFLAYVRRQYPDTVRIILTGHANLETAVRAINENGIYRFLLKPCNGLDLAITIRRALEFKQLLDKARSLLKAAAKQSMLLRQLEKEHPGITKVERNDAGAIITDEPQGNLNALIEKIDAEIKNSETFWQDILPATV